MVMQMELLVEIMFMCLKNDSGSSDGDRGQVLSATLVVMNST